MAWKNFQTQEQGRLIQAKLRVSLNGGDKVQIQRWLELTG